MSSIYIVAIAWLYVVFMMSITEQTAVAGIMTFFLYGALPLTIVLYLMDTPRRKRNRQLKEKNELMARQAAHQSDLLPEAQTDLAPAPAADTANFSNASEPKP